MPTDDALLRAVLADPEDDAPRLIYADWLDEHGQSARAEFIRVQVALARLAEDDPGRTDLSRRERALLAAHRTAWAAPLDGAALSWTFRRGFIEEVALAAANFLRRGDRLFAVAPVRGVRLYHVGTRVPELAACPHLSAVACLDLDGEPVHPSHLGVLLASPHLTRLTALSLASSGLARAAVEALARSAVLGSLRRLDLAGNPLHNEGAARLAACPRLSGLRHLGLHWCGVGNRGAQALASSAYLAGLASLDLRNNPVGDQGRPALLERFGDRVKL